MLSRASILTSTGRIRLSWAAATGEQGYLDLGAVIVALLAGRRMRKPYAQPLMPGIPF
jgi:hypothetical protein